MIRDAKGCQRMCLLLFYELMNTLFFFLFNLPFKEAESFPNRLHLLAGCRKRSKQETRCIFEPLDIFFSIERARRVIRTKVCRQQEEVRQVPLFSQGIWRSFCGIGTNALLKEVGLRHGIFWEDFFLFKETPDDFAGSAEGLGKVLAVSVENFLWSIQV